MGRDWDICGALAGLARRQGTGEMLHRTAARVPGKLAIVSGQTRLMFARAGGGGVADSGRPGGRRPGQRLALLSHNCWQFAVLSFATARLGVGAGRFHARPG